MTAAQNPNDLFWLARYAHNKLEPVFEQARTIDPSIRVSIEMSFANSASHRTEGHVNVFAHWSREDMFLYSPGHKTQAGIDTVAERLQAKVDKLKADAQQQEILTLLEPVSY